MRLEEPLKPYPWPGLPLCPHYLSPAFLSELRERLHLS